MDRTNDLHIAGMKPLPSPSDIKKEYPMPAVSVETVLKSRQIIGDIISGSSSLMLGVLGPCSIHDPKAAMEYAIRLKELREKVGNRIYLVMRVYFEKPRTTIGWKGLITDPHIDNSYDVAAGLKIARDLLIKITSMGIPVASEMLDPIVPQYIADMISWAAIGARTTESQTHREMASGLSMPVGLKNGTSGNLKLAVDAMKSTYHAHHFIGIDQDGRSCVISTTGNKAVHIIMRGGRSGPNYYEENVEEAEELITAAGMNPAVVIDCSHSNSGKEYSRQLRVLTALLDQRVRGRKTIVGFMLESNLFSGRQDIVDDISKLKFGVSITDECIGWDDTEKAILEAYNRLREEV